MHTTYLTINLTRVRVDCIGITTIAEHKALVVIVHGWEHPTRAVLVGDPAQRVPMLMKIPELSSPLLTEQEWREVREALIFSEENTRRCVEIMTTHIRGRQ